MKAPTGLLFFAVPQIGLIILTTAMNANNIHRLLCHLECDRYAAAIPEHPQARPNIVAPCAPVREGSQILAIVHNSINISCRHGGRSRLSYMALQLIQLVESFRGETNSMGHSEVGRLRLSARC